MLKKGFVLCIVLLLLLTASSFATEQGINIYVNKGEVSQSSIEFDVKPFINSDNRTLVPVRFISETLGYDVTWNAEDYQVEIERDDLQVILPVNSKSSFVNTVEKTFDTMTIIKDGRTFVPLRFISETFGAEVEYKNGRDNRSGGEVAHIIDINVEKGVNEVVEENTVVEDVNYFELDDWKTQGWQTVGSLKNAPYTSQGSKYVNGKFSLDAFDEAIVEIGENLKLGKLNISPGGQISLDNSEAGKNANQFYDSVELDYSNDGYPVIGIRTWVSTDNVLGMPQVYAMNGTREMLKYFTNSADAEAIYDLIDTSFKTKSFAYDYGEKITFGNTTFKITIPNVSGASVDVHILETN